MENETIKKEANAVSVIDRRYAKAIFTLIDTKGEKAELWEKSLRSAVNLFNENVMSRYLNSPVNPESKKLQVIEEVVSQAGSDIHPHCKNFLKLLVQNSRFSNLSSIFEAFLAEQGRRAGHLRVSVSCASPLMDEDKKNIQRLALEKMNASSEFTKFNTSSVEETLDPSLLAGFIVEFENRRLDLSLSGKMKRLMNAVSA